MAPGDKEQNRFLWVTVAFIVVALLFVFSFFADYYTHPMPEKDCTQAYDYPICERKYEPALPVPPNFLGYAGGILLALIIVGAFIYTSWNASVLHKDWYTYKEKKLEVQKKK